MKPFPQLLSHGPLVSDLLEFLREAPPSLSFCPWLGKLRCLELWDVPLPWPPHLCATQLFLTSIARSLLFFFSVSLLQVAVLYLFSQALIKLSPCFLLSPLKKIFSYCDLGFIGNIHFPSNKMSGARLEKKRLTSMLKF